jgi:hypothetical protein
MGIQHWAKVAAACAASLALSGCLILPGEFASDMTVRRNGDFSFSYKGQIQLVGIATLLKNDFLNDGTAAEFKAVCYADTVEPASNISDDLIIESKKDNVAAHANSRFSVLPASFQTDTAGPEDAAASAAKAAEDAAQAAADAAEAAASSWELNERECTADEVTQQRADWDTQQAEKKKRDEEGRKMAEMMLGGIDPENPETILRFTREVERLAAWHKVEHLGNGVFLVDYSTSGKLADDYAFPVIPRYALGEPMIHITRWDNGRVRVEAPAFKTDPEMSMTALLGMSRLAGGMLGKGGSDKVPAEPVTIKGRFTLTTDARILANNSEEGPEDVGGLEKLTWDIGPASYGAPMALLKLN